MENTFTITADSTPDFDDWGWDDYWGVQDWITWHKAMKAKYGLDYANRTLLQNYLYESGAFAASDSWRASDNSFIDYAKANGFYESLFPGPGGVIGQIAGTGYQIVTGIHDTTSNVTETVVETSEAAGSTISNIFKTTKWLLPVVIVVVVVGILWAAWGNRDKLVKRFA